MAMLSYANFGQSPHKFARTVSEATRLVKQREPELECDGEMQAQVAFDRSFREKYWPHSTLKSDPNLFVFPALGAANTAYQLVSRVAGIDEIGPVLLGLRKPVTVVPPQAPVNTIVQMTAMTALHAIQGSDWGRASVPPPPPP
ncbi:MAG: hypothetical protein HY744_18155 [Deltaproteobacteria bacterium]|nr:hypothetical protein [Deltaproteobacteria bacterium]